MTDDETKCKLLRVMDNKDFFCGGAVFDKVDGQWVMRTCAPYLKKVLQGVPVEKMGEFLKSKGWTYEWL